MAQEYIIPTGHVLKQGANSFTFPSGSGTLARLSDITPGGTINGTIAANQLAFGTALDTIGGDSNLLWDNTNKHLALGVANNANTRLNILKTFSTVAGTSTYGIRNVTNYTVDSDNFVKYGFSQETYLGAAISNTAGLVGIRSWMSYGDSSGNTPFINFLANGVVNADPGNCPNWYLFKAEDISNAGGAITNQYGLHVSSLTTATNNWAVYTAGTTKSYFGGAVGINKTVPTAQLEIIGTGTGSGTYGLKIHDSTGTSNSFMVRNDGNVGIGIAPTSLFHVYKSAGATSATGVSVIESAVDSITAGASLLIKNTNNGTDPFSIIRLEQGSGNQIGEIFTYKPRNRDLTFRCGTNKGFEFVNLSSVSLLNLESTGAAAFKNTTSLETTLNIGADGVSYMKSTSAAALTIPLTLWNGSASDNTAVSLDFSAFNTLASTGRIKNIRLSSGQYGSSFEVFSGASLLEIFRITGSGLGLGTTSFGANSAGVFAQANGTAPTAPISTQYHQYCIGGIPKFMTGAGDVIVLNKGAAVADASGGATIDTEARAAINALLARMRVTGGNGLIAD